MSNLKESSFEINNLLENMRVNPFANNGKENYFLCESGDKLYYRTWKSSNQKKIVVAIHGMCAHSEYYILVADQLIDKGITIYALDIKGHGQSSGRKGDIKSFREVLHQINEFITRIHEDNSDCPIFLMGLSMGGMLTINYAVLYPELIKGVILFAPGVKSNFKFKASDIAKSPLLLVAFPFVKGKPIIRIAKRSGISSRNPLRLEYNEQDKYRLEKLSLRFLIQMGIWVRRAFKNAQNLSHPILIMQGTDDKLVSPEGIQDFFDNLIVEDKSLEYLDGAYHSLFSDSAMVEQSGWEKIKKWISSH